ncbi:hypothetical protein [uncultured Sphingomonas sp.]|uniref:hypothetical protein n=1 Tax=uncultured Sphingomonas sp. TaxID=158754 RepID=UPI0035CA8374
MKPSMLLPALALALAGCQRAASTAPPDAASTATSLEKAAIAAGIVADPDRIGPTGLYARDSDRLCVVPNGTAFRVGMFVDYGDDHNCAATGAATHDGERLHIDLATVTGCRFDARFEGDRVVFPGSLPDACRKACTRRASLDGLAVERLSDSPSEAAALRGGSGKLLCTAGH